MSAEHEYDELVMTLVESTLARPREEREQFLRTVCRANPELYDEVQSRVAWEDRMGNFLREPLIIPRETLDRPFEPGTRIAGRFTVVREVGRGGMGVVYEATDEKLDRRIAIKCAQRGFRNRLPPEARMASDISHFNVCKVHELHVASTPQGEIDFLTMEFVEGETLAERLSHSGPLAQSEVHEIAVQVCAGLAQAHRQGVIHGDLKPGNIILAGTPQGGLRAVLTDFGLAKLKVTDSGGAVMSTWGGGTLDYMAPELFHGLRASIASDVYALGIILHEMITGRTPLHLGGPPGTGMKDAARATTLSAPSLEKAIPTAGGRTKMADSVRQVEDLPAPYQRIVTRCLGPTPEERFSSVDSIAALLGERPQYSKWILALLLTLAAILAIVLWQTRAPEGTPVRLAVFPLSVEGFPLPAATGIGVDVAERLSGIRRSFVVIGPRELQSNRVTTPEEAKAILGATHVLRTNLLSSQNTITVRASVADAASGQTLRELKAAYPAKNVQVLAKALASMVTAALRLRVGVPAEIVAQAAYAPYIQGVALIRRDSVSANEAIPLFEKAAEADPRSALVYAGLAEAQLQKYWQTQRHEKLWLDYAKSSAAKASGINQDSVPVLLVAGMLKREERKDQLAVQDYLRATELEPNNSEPWRLLAMGYDVLNRPDDAVAAYHKSIEAQPDYYRAYLDFGNYLVLRGQYKEAEEKYRKVIAAAPGLDIGYHSLGGVLMPEGRYAEAEVEMMKALGIRETYYVLNNLGALYNYEGRDAEALEYYKKAIATGHTSIVLYHNIADTYRRLGSNREAADAYQRGRAMAETELMTNPNRAMSRAYLALFSARLGERARAEFEIAQARSLEPENARVMRLAALTFEVLKEREKTLQTLRGAPAYLLSELSRQPDLKNLQRDPHFLELQAKQPNQ